MTIWNAVYLLLGIGVCVLADVTKSRSRVVRVRVRFNKLGFDEKYNDGPKFVQKGK